MEEGPEEYTVQVQIGSLVRLRSGGPLMTVQGRNNVKNKWYKIPDEIWTCNWIGDTGIPYETCYYPEQLIIEKV